jgi:signal transduction histidine kinase
VRVAVAIDTREIDSVIVALRRTLGMALSIMAVGLIGAAIAQITFGLWPLSRIRRGLAAIRLGHARRLPDDLPAEVMPLAQGLNDVLAANEVVVQRARIQAGNLAHALKTPLAVLMDEAERLKARGESGALILRECERMRRQIESHLARARAAASSASVTAATPLMPALASLVSAIGRLYRDRDLRFEMPGDDHEILVSCEAEDLDEILGNLMDNAAKWARTRIAVRIDPSIPGRVRIFVEDDGPGMPADASESVFRVGQRLDEQMPGSGLGLAIVRDVAELYGGRAWIERTDGDGTTVGLELPAEVPAMSPVVRRERPN